MKFALRMYDFIKSWMYYPKMERYLKEKGIANCFHTRFQYALWHCKQGMLSDINLEKSEVTISAVKSAWKNVYNIPPINK